MGRMKSKCLRVTARIQAAIGEFPISGYIVLATYGKPGEQDRLTVPRKFMSDGRQIPLGEIPSFALITKPYPHLVPLSDELVDEVHKRV